MNNVFISGIPASGKSYLAEKIVKARGVKHIDIDRLRQTMVQDPHLKPWVNFFWEKDEERYWANVTCEEHWENLKKQSEAFWPVIKKKVNEIISQGIPAIFEGVNILPHLAAKDFTFPGIFLLGESAEMIFERIKKDPRWGKTEALQRKEAEMLFLCERPKLEKEAKKFGFETFVDQDEAEKELLHLLGIL